MRYNHIEALGRNASVLEFGCASLGSRIGAPAGARAIHLALDQGIHWFDVAPPYGDGKAELLLGRALGKRRAEAIICTKFGLARPRISTAKLLRPLAQRTLGLHPQLRAKLNATRYHGERLPIRADTVECWVNESLQRLGTDYIDVCALHDPVAAEPADDTLFEALADLKRRGVILAVAVAGSIEAPELAVHDRREIDIVQFADSPHADSTARLAGADIDRRLGLGIPRRIRSWHTRALREGAGRNAEPPCRTDAIARRRASLVAFRLLLRYALSSNADGVVITSMYDPRHLETNCRMASRPPEPELARAVRGVLGRASTPTAAPS